MSGTVTGLTGGLLVLQVNGGADINVSGNGTVSLATGLANGSAYTVAIRSQPATPPHNCTVASASGTIAGAAVSNVAIACAPLPALSLLSSTPANAAVAVDVEGALTLTFSAPLATTPAPQTTATLRADASGEVIALPTGSVSGANLTLNPGASLALRTGYTLTFSTDLRGVLGESPSAPIVIHFTTRDGAWQEPIRLDSLAGDLSELDIAMNDDGDAMLVFSRELTGSNSLHALRYTPASGWEDDVELASNIEIGSQKQVVLDDSGNAFASWMEVDSQSVTHARVRRYLASSNTWGTALEPGDPTSDVNYLAMDVDAAGNACVAWTQTSAVWVSRYEAAVSNGWSTPQQISPPQSSGAPYVNYDANCRVAWSGVVDSWISQEQGIGRWLSPRRFDSAA